VIRTSGATFVPKKAIAAGSETAPRSSTARTAKTSGSGRATPAPSIAAVRRDSSACEVSTVRVQSRGTAAIARMSRVTR
jgi:hypothetical protein